MNFLSAFIICKNEEAHLERCLSSISWADEIVLVDALSQDRTQEIALNPASPWAGKLKFLERPWTGFKDQRNYALSQTTHDWVFCLDADEACSPELKLRLQEILKEQHPKQKYFKVRRVEYFLGKEIHFGIWNPSFQDRFFYKPGIQYINNIHEYPPYPSVPDRLFEPILHSPDFNIEKFLDKMNRYTSIEALDRVRQGKRTNAFRIFFAFPAMFLKNFFYYKSYRDGFLGFVISILEGISRAVRHIKMWQCQNAIAVTSPSSDIQKKVVSSN